MASEKKIEVTLIIASSVDGCLVGSESDVLDPNRSWKDSKQIRGLVQQFFDFSPKTSENFNLINASTLINIGVNSSAFIPKKTPINLIVLDIKHELTTLGISQVAKSVKKLIVIRKKGVKLEQGQQLPRNCSLMAWGEGINLAAMIKILETKHQVKKITVQSAGKLNHLWLASGVVDFLTVILYPIMVGNNGTPILSGQKKFGVKPLLLLGSHVFDTNYSFLRYAVINQ